MAFIDWWVPRVGLEADETTRWTMLANQTVSAWRAVGGELVATDRRLVFRPNRVDESYGAKVWSVPLASIRAVGRKRRSLGIFSGGLRKRLRLVTDDGVEHLFVVNRLDDAVARTEALVLDHAR